MTKSNPTKHARYVRDQVHRRLPTPPAKQINNTPGPGDEFNFPAGAILTSGLTT